MSLKDKEKYPLYLKAFEDVVRKRIDDKYDRQLIKQNVLYGVRIINMLPKPGNYEESFNVFQLATTIKATIGLLTPSEFLNVFPIEKDFKGYKYGTKDYFYTINYLNSLDPDKPIGEETTRLLWDYTNWEITIFSVSIMGFMSDIRRFEGQPSLAEEWANVNGVKTYTKYADATGEKFLVDDQGRMQKINKQRHKHLKLVK